MDAEPNQVAGIAVAQIVEADHFGQLARQPVGKSDVPFGKIRAIAERMLSAGTVETIEQGVSLTVEGMTEQVQTINEMVGKFLRLPSPPLHNGRARRGLQR